MKGITMKKRILLFACAGVIFFICAYGLVLKDGGSKTQTANRKPEVGKYLFNANEMDSVEITGKELRERKEVSTLADITADKKMELIIKRDDVGEAISMSVFDNISGVNLVIHLGKDTLDEWCGAKEGFYYQMAAYDFNKDGKREIVVAAGNKKDVLELSVLEVNSKEKLSDKNPSINTEIRKGCKSYVDKNRDICVLNSTNDLLSVCKMSD